MEYQEWCDEHNIIPDKMAFQKWCELHNWFMANAPAYLHTFYKMPPFDMKFTETTATGKIKFNNSKITGITVEILEDNEMSEVVI